ncbi:hypothetical protein JTB14_025523 [Gonioctena quinquepunctata]|nr:hypothetical protein JTB14_025523 [Gonioctena quinquepunctata]
MNRNREHNGFFAAVLKDMGTLEADSDQHFEFMRMSKEMYDHSLQLLGPSLQKNRKKYHLTPDHRLAMTIHYLAAGCSMREIAWTYKVGVATVHVIVKETWNMEYFILDTTSFAIPGTMANNFPRIF